MHFFNTADPIGLQIHDYLLPLERIDLEKSSCSLTSASGRAVPDGCRERLSVREGLGHRSGIAAQGLE